MRRSIGAAFAGLLLWAGAVAAEDGETAIPAALDLVEQALERRDVQTLFSHHAPDYVGTGLDGNTTTLLQARADAVQVLRLAKYVAQVHWIDELTVTGSTAAVVIRERTILVLANPETGQPRLFDIRNRIAFGWREEGGRWLIASSRTLEETVTTVDLGP